MSFRGQCGKFSELAEHRGTDNNLFSAGKRLQRWDFLLEVSHSRTLSQESFIHSIYSYLVGSKTA